MASTSQLRELLELLKEYGVLEYTHEGLSLKLGGSISVHKHGADAAAEARVPTKPLDPEIVKRFRSLPADYQRVFTIGQD